MYAKKIEFNCCDCKKILIKKNSKHIRCLSCTNSRKSKVQKLTIKTCEYCDADFEIVQQNQRFCTQICRKNHDLNESNGKWIDKKKKKGAKAWKEDITMTLL